MHVDTQLLRSRRLFMLAAFFAQLVKPESVFANTRQVAIQRIDPPLQLSRHQIFDMDGKQSYLPQHKSGIHVINLWATWCAPCVKELPSLKRFSDRFERSEFQVTLLSQDKGGPAVSRDFLERLGIRGVPSFSDPRGRYYIDSRSRGLPTTLLAGPDGRIRGKIEGEIDWDSKDLPDQIRRLF